MDFTRIKLRGLYEIDMPIVGLDPSASYIFKSASGLGPTGQDVAISQRKYQGRKPLDREITLLVALQPDYSVGQTVGQLRDPLYGLMTPGVADEMVVEFYFGSTLVALTKGHVSKCEINPFSDEPEMQLTIPCFEPYLRAPAPVSVTGLHQKFPVINNVGTAPAGFEMAVIIRESRTRWNINRGTQKMQFDSSFLPGDTLKFNTNENEQNVQRVRGGVTVSLLESLSSDSVWFQLIPGPNNFTAVTADFDWGAVTYTPQFLGV